MNTAQALDLIGKKVKDKITGFEGVVTGVAVYLAGCHQACIFPRVAADGKLPEAQWLDCVRLEVDAATPAVVLAVAKEAPGGDGPSAPRR